MFAGDLVGLRVTTIAVIVSVYLPLAVVLVVEIVKVLAGPAAVGIVWGEN